MWGDFNGGNSVIGYVIHMGNIWEIDRTDIGLYSTSDGKIGKHMIIYIYICMYVLAVLLI
jgi:hypothetical protein